MRHNFIFTHIKVIFLKHFNLFFFILFGLFFLFEHTDITSLTDIFHSDFTEKNGLTPYELSLFFTIFVFMQFWNMFNARAFMTKRSGLKLRGCGEFGLIALIILIGQIVIIQIGGQFFNVVPLSFTDWAIILGSTSLVLWIGEISRFLSRRK